MNVRRRSLIGTLAALPALTFAQPAPRTTAKPAAKVAGRLRVVIPANAGGGWDQTGRALGASMLAAGVADEIEYENKGGKGGIIGLAHYHEKYRADPNTLLMGGMVMVGSVALNKPAVDLAQVAPIARLTSDYLVVVVAGNSPVRNASDLSRRMQADLKGTPVAGGGAGGVDHIFAGTLAKAVGANPGDLRYLPFASGPEVAEAVASGKAAVGVSGFSELRELISAQGLRVIGVSSKKSVFGFPAFRDQGLGVEMANWRGVFTGGGVDTARRAELEDGVRRATQHDSWKQVLKQNGWESSWLAGAQLASFIDFDLTTARVMVHLLKLKA